LADGGIQREYFREVLSVCTHMCWNRVEERVGVGIKYKIVFFIIYIITSTWPTKQAR
jgi:hypothetical protein